MTKLTYTGPPHQQCHALAQLTGVSALLEPGREYEMPAEFADRLAASSQHWSRESAPKPPTMKELRAAAAELGLKVPSKAKVAQLRALVDQARLDAAGDDTDPTDDEEN